MVLEDLYGDTIPVNKGERSLVFPLNLDIIQASSIHSSQFGDKDALRLSFFRDFAITYLSDTVSVQGRMLLKGYLYVYIF